MASLKKRGNMWWAQWYAGGEQVRRSTGVHVKPGPGDGVRTARELKKIAMQAAELFERTAARAVSFERAQETLRDLAELPEVETVGESLDRRTESRRREGRLGNWRAAERALRRLMPELMGWRVDRLRLADGQDYVSRLLEEVSAGTVDRHLNEVMSWLNRLVAEEVLEKNPWRGLRVPRDKRESGQEREPFTREDLARILGSGEGEWPDMVAVCLLLGGQRLGDVARLRWEQVDWERETIRLRTAKTSRWMLKPLLRPLRMVLERRRAMLGPEELVIFPYSCWRYGAAGDSSNKLSLEFGQLLDRLGIERWRDDGRQDGKSRAKRMAVKSFHALRTTATTFLLDLGVSPALVQHIVGHQTADIELRHYYRPGLEQEARAVGQMALALGLTEPEEGKKRDF